MLTLSSPAIAAPSPADRLEATARAAARATAEQPARHQAAQARPPLPAASGPALADGLGVVALQGVTTASLPAALGRMRDIAVATSSGSLTDSDRIKLQAEYSQLSQQVTHVVATDVQQQVQTPVPGVTPKDAAGDNPPRDHAQGGSDSGHPRAPADGRRDARTAGAAAPAPAPAPDTPPIATPAFAPVAAALRGAPSALAQFRQPAAPARPALSVVA